MFRNVEDYEKHIEELYSSESEDDIDDDDYVPPAPEVVQDRTKLLLEAVAEKLIPAEGTQPVTRDSSPLLDSEGLLHEKDGTNETVAKESTSTVPASEVVENDGEVKESTASEPVKQAKDNNNATKEDEDALRALFEDKPGASEPEPVKPPPKLTRKERLLQLLKDRVSTTRPTLTPDSSDVVDLDDDLPRHHPPVDNFVNSVLRNIHVKQKKPTMGVVSQAEK